MNVNTHIIPLDKQKRVLFPYLSMRLPKTGTIIAPMKKGIPIFSYRDIEEVYNRLRDGKPLVGYSGDQF